MPTEYEISNITEADAFKMVRLNEKHLHIVGYLSPMWSCSSYIYKLWFQLWLRWLFFSVSKLPMAQQFIFLG